MRGGLILGVAAALAWSLPAYAQSDRELATRQELIAQASALADQGKHAEALAMMKRAAAIKMTPSARLFIAQEQSALGLLADAYGSGRQCRVEAEADTRLNSRDTVIAQCKALEDSLGRRVGRVTVKLPDPAPPGVRVTVSGEELSAALIGAPYVVSPGKLAVVVTATGYLPYHSDVDVPEGSSPVIDVTLAIDPAAQACPSGQERVHGACVAACSSGKVRTADEGAQCCWAGQTWSGATLACAGGPQCPAGLVGQGMDCVLPTLAPVVPPPPTRMSTPRKLAIAAGATGAAAIVFGTVFGAVALAERGTAEGNCPNYAKLAFPAMAVTEERLASKYADVSTWGFIAGGVLLAGGVTLYLASPRSSASVGLRLVPGGGGVAGSF